MVTYLEGLRTLYERERELIKLRKETAKKEKEVYYVATLLNLYAPKIEDLPEVIIPEGLTVRASCMWTIRNYPGIWWTKKTLAYCLQLRKNNKASASSLRSAVQSALNNLEQHKFIKRLYGVNTDFDTDFDVDFDAQTTELRRKNIQIVYMPLRDRQIGYRALLKNLV
jgi:hypothetical protein